MIQIQNKSISISSSFWI